MKKKEKKEVITYENYDILKEQQNEMRDYEQFYINGTVKDLTNEIENRKQEIVNNMVNFAKNHRVPCKWDKDGNAINYEVKCNPIVINNLYLKPIIEIGSIEPDYNAEQLSIVFDYYCYLITEINDKIGNFPASITSFCKLAGITYSGLKKYKNGPDLNMRIIADKIFDQIGDTNLTMSQMGMVREKSTIFKLKTENEIVEKKTPNVNVNIEIEKPNMDRINNRIQQYTYFAKKKGK